MRDWKEIEEKIGYRFENRRLLQMALRHSSYTNEHRMDRLDGRSSRRFLPAGFWKFRPLDGVVGFVLLYWHIWGANTSDDGYTMTVTKVDGRRIETIEVRKQSPNPAQTTTKAGD